MAHPQGVQLRNKAEIVTSSRWTLEMCPQIDPGATTSGTNANGEGANDPQATYKGLPLGRQSLR